MTAEDKMILGFSREIKIQCLKDALEQDKFGIFMGLSKILLDAPINSSGIETEVIERIYLEYIEKEKAKKIKL